MYFHRHPAHGIRLLHCCSPELPTENESAYCTVTRIVRVYQVGVLPAGYPTRTGTRQILEIGIGLATG